MLKLNEKQIHAVSHGAGPMLVLAGPGSGKTTVISHRISALIEGGADPRQILVITFTKLAAEEMKARFAALAPDVSGVTFGTFHAFFFRVVRDAHGYTAANVLKDEHRMEMLRSLAYSHKQITGEDDEDFVQSLSAEISLVKNDLLDLRYYQSRAASAEVFRDIMRAYENRKRELGKIDFDDMLTLCHELFTDRPEVLDRWRKRYKYILIDEFQDINRAQYECVQMLAANDNNVFAVGDDDQSIYRFRGSRPEFLLKFPDDFPGAKIVKLDTNYRSTERIIKAANAVISSNTKRYEKQISGAGRTGGKLSLITTDDIGSEAAAIASAIRRAGPDMFAETAVIFRTNIQARAFADILRDLKIPYWVKERIPGIYEHWTARDILSYIRLAFDPAQNDAAARIINRPSRYVTNRALKLAKQHGSILHALLNAELLPYWQQQKIEELLVQLNIVKRRNTHAAFKYIREIIGYNEYVTHYGAFRKIDTKPLFEILDELQEAAKAYPDLNEFLRHAEMSVAEAKDDRLNAAPPENAVTLSTMHGVKGLEFETVYVAGVVDSVIPHERSRMESELEEECRLLYVAMTRAKTSLVLSVTRTRYDKEVQPSRFISALRGGPRKEQSNET